MCYIYIYISRLNVAPQQKKENHSNILKGLVFLSVDIVIVKHSLDMIFIFTQNSNTVREGMIYNPHHGILMVYMHHGYKMTL